MNMRVIRKAIGLLIVDIVIIIGIFILQFRTDSSILKKIGNLQISMAKSETEDNSFALQNKLEVSYNGITLHSDDQNSIKIIQKDEPVAKNIKLISYTEEELQYTFNFTDDISVVVMLAQKEGDSPLTVYADIPKDVTDLYIPFNFSYNTKILNQENNKIIIEGKKQNWSVNASEIVENYLHLTYADNLAHYAIYDESKKFTLDDLINLASAEKSAYDQTVNTINTNLINTFKTSLNENNFTEQAVVAYISAMAKNGKYKAAIDDIPQDYKKSDSRTYLSAPFLNSLANMNTKLDSIIKDSNNKIKVAATNGMLDIFTIQNLAARLCIYSDKADVTTILRNAASADASSLTLAQISGILKTYVELLNLNQDYAVILEPVLDKCIQRITEACTFENDVLTISENDTFLSVVQAAETGVSLMRYGMATRNDTYTKAGRVIVNSYLGESSSFDLRTLSTIYPLLAYDNTFYPHIQLIHGSGKDVMWAWTCANDIKYATDDEGALVLSIDFPLEHTHYVILKGIPAFEQIFIYDMAFRTDPRFETYNSSGYVYKSDTQTLLLKSRHKSQIEKIRMSYKPVVKAAPAPAPKPVEKPAEPEPKEESTEASDNTAGTETSTLTETASGTETTETPIE